VPIAAGKRRFGLPEEAPPPAAPPSNYSRPPASDIQYFNGRQERDREPERPKEEYRRDERRDDYSHRRDDYRRDERDDRERERYADRERDRGGDGERRERPRWDEEKPKEPERDREPAPVDGESFLPKFLKSPINALLTRSSSMYHIPFRRLLAAVPEIFARLPFHHFNHYCPFISPACRIPDGPRKRRSRWGDATERVEVPGMPVAVMGKVSQTELDNYAIHVRLEEINRKLRTGDVVPPDGQR
jgi:splicing factor 1